MDTTSTTTAAVPGAAPAAGGYRWPPPRCPSHLLALLAGPAPVACHCPAGRLGHRVMVADLEEAAEQAEQYATGGPA